jgi:GNAT superfamily N-acetyltransferase
MSAQHASDPDARRHGRPQQPGGSRERRPASEPPAIRAAHDEEVDAIHALVERAYRPYVTTIGFRPPPMDVDHAPAVARGEVFVVAEPALVGLIVLVEDADRLQIENVAVDPERQDTGIGGALLDFAEWRARERRLRRMRLQTHERMTRNLSIYARRGFAREPKAPGDRLPRVVLSKQLR